MKRLLFISWMMLLLLVLAACSPAATPTPEPISVLQGYLNGLNAGDIDKALAFIADDAVFIDTGGKHTGQAKIRATLRSWLNDGLTIHARDFSEENGRVVYKAHFFIRDGEVDMLKALTIVKDGKIVFDGTEATWSAECDRDASQVFCAAK
jgi:hypothetical protein